jgi:DHA1 family multidrug resistance protein-like MFS transporter
MTATKPAEINWKRNLFFIWSSQVLSLMAFSFAMSFAAYYIQDLGITDPKDVKFWNGAFAASAPLAMAVMGPIWGIIGDRVGRRPMMLRAYFCATVIIFLMGRVTNVHQLIVLRVA